MGRQCLRGVIVLLAIGRPVVSETSSSVATFSDTVVNGAIELVSVAAVEACNFSCIKGLSAAFDLREEFIACLCPDYAELSSAPDTRRRHLLPGDYDGLHDPDEMVDLTTHPYRGLKKEEHENELVGGRYLRGLTEEDVVAESAAFAVRVPGGLEAGTIFIDRLSSSLGLVASVFGVPESELIFSTLTVAPPHSVKGGPLSIVAETVDASDISIVGSRTDSSDLVAGDEGVALFLSLVVLLVGTFCCGCCFTFALLRSSKYGKGKTRGKGGGSRKRKDRRGDGSNGFLARGSKKSWFSPSPTSLSPPHGQGSFTGTAATNNVEGSSLNGFDSPLQSPPLLTPVQEGLEEGGATTNFAKSFGPRKKSSEDSGIAGHKAGSYTSSGAAASALAGQAGPHSGNTPGEREDTVERSLLGTPAAAEGVGNSSTPGGTRESRGTNPLYKSAAVLSTRGGGGPVEKSAGGTQGPGKMNKNVETPTRGRLGGFLGNVTPARLRRLAGRAMSSRSPGDPNSHNRSSSAGSSRSGKSGRTVRRRRDQTFPGKYDQKNSSEMDHQRPPADPVYTYMIKTIAAKGFKFMTTTEIAFCAMRMYSHFRRTEGHFKRLAMMKHAENVPPVYEIIWQCDTGEDQVSGGQSRFFSCSRGTDAEQQKSLLACLLALDWNGTYSSRRTLETALTPTSASDVPQEEDIFWDDFKDSTDALSGDDAIVVLSRVIILVANSSRQPGQSPAGISLGSVSGGDLAAGGTETYSTVQHSPAETTASTVAVAIVDHGDIMRALSGAHLREIGISIKSARPGWQEAYVQLVSVLLVVDFLEDNARKISPGGQRPDALISLDWISSLSEKELDRFLIKNLDARKKLVELDLEPSGLVIKHDEDGQVERVEPAVLEKKSSLGSRKSRSSSRSRKHRRTHSSGSTSSVEPVVITTINRRQHSEDSAGGRPVSVISNTSAMSNNNTTHSGLRTIAQVRASAASSNNISSAGSKAPSASSARGTGTMGGRPDLTILGRGSVSDISGPPTRPDEDGAAVGEVLAGYAGVSTAGESVRSGLSNVEGLMSGDERSEASSVVTRVYAPSHAGDSSQDAFGRGSRFSSFNQGSQQILSFPPTPGGLASPMNDRSMSQTSFAGSRHVHSPPPNGQRQQLQQQGIGKGRGAMPMVSPSAVSVAASRFEDIQQSSKKSLDISAAGSDAGDAAGGVGASGGDANRSRKPPRFDAQRLEMSSEMAAQARFELATPNSAAGSRFPDSPSSQGGSRLAGSPAGLEGGGHNLHTSRSDVSSMRSGSFFPTDQTSSTKSGLVESAGSHDSWDEEDVQNLGAQWLNDRAYNKKFSS